MSAKNQRVKNNNNNNLSLKDLHYIIQLIEDELNDDHQEELREELTEELYTLEPDTLIELILQLANNKKYEVLKVVLDSIEPDYILTHKELFEDFFDIKITNDKMKKIINEFKNKIKSKSTLKNKLRS
jgi:hypothetical protein